MKANESDSVNDEKINDELNKNTNEEYEERKEKFGKLKSYLESVWI